MYYNNVCTYNSCYIVIHLYLTANLKFVQKFELLLHLSLFLACTEQKEKVNCILIREKPRNSKIGTSLYRVRTSRSWERRLHLYREYNTLRNLSCIWYLHSTTCHARTFVSSSTYAAWYQETNLWCRFSFTSKPKVEPLVKWIWI